MTPSRIMPLQTPFRVLVLVITASLAVGATATVVVPWKRARASSAKFESHATFDPRTGDLYFVRSSPSFQGWRLMPDGTRLIVMAGDGLYESRARADGWSPRVKLGPEVNVNGSEIGALFSPSGKSLLFARDTKGPDSGEFFVWRGEGDEAWPPACPAAADARP